MLSDMGMMINRRRAYGGKSLPYPDILPSGYTQLEYLESTGTQYIDTGLRITTDLRMDLTFQNLSADTKKYLFGLYDSNIGGNFYLYNIIVNGVLTFQTAWGCQYANTSKSADMLKHDASFYITNDKTHVLIDNQEVLTKNALGKMPTANIIIAGSLMINSTSSRTYSVKFYRNNTLVHNLIPVKRNSDNVLGMYDIIAGKFLTNQGTGDFIAGPEV